MVVLMELFQKLNQIKYKVVVDGALNWWKIRGSIPNMVVTLVWLSEGFHQGCGIRVGVVNFRLFLAEFKSEFEAGS